MALNYHMRKKFQAKKFREVLKIWEKSYIASFKLKYCKWILEKNA